jgi:hypothetical protein
MRQIDHNLVIPLAEPADHQAAGLDFDSFNAGAAAHWDIFVQFGALTDNSVLKVYVGASAAAKTTALTFRYRYSDGDYKAASADLFETADATSAALTLTAGTYDHRVLYIALDGPEVADATPWVTIEVDATATVLLMSAIAIGSNARRPRVTALA